MRKPSVSSQTPDSVWLTYQDFEFLCYRIVKTQMEYGEPIPNFSTHDKDLLQSSLGQPRQTFSGQLLYPTLEKQAAILFYSLVKNHPFKNGNKRLAVMSLLAFLFLNGKWINLSTHELYELACQVSESKPNSKAKLLSIIETTLIAHLEILKTLKL